MVIQQHVFMEQVEELHKQLIELASDDRIIERFQENDYIAQQRKDSKSCQARLKLAECELAKV